MPEKRLRPDGVSSRRFGSGRQPRQPADVPIGPDAAQTPISRESEDAPVAVNRFAGLGNRMLSRAIPLALLVMGMLGIALGIVGYRSLLNSTSGSAADVDTGADVASVRAAPFTETTMVAWVHDGALTSASLLAVDQSFANADAAEFSTGVVVFSADSQLDATGPALRDVWSSQGAAGLGALISDRFNIEIDYSVALAAEGLADVANALPPLAIDLEESLVSTGDGGSVIVDYVAGETAIAPGEFGPVAAWLNPTDGEARSRSARFTRQADLWTAMQAAISREDAAVESLATLVVFGDVSTDAALGRALLGLTEADSSVELASLRTSRSANPIPTDIVDDVATAEQISRIVRYPRPAPGNERVRIRLLDGGGDGFLAADIGAAVVREGAQIVTLGRFDRNGAEVTRLIAHDGTSGTGSAEDAGPFAEMLAELLGVESVEHVDSGTESFDFTIVVGADAQPPGER